MIPYAMTYTSSAKGRVTKTVTCESCKTKYVYVMERRSVNQATSMLFLDNRGASARADSQAKKSLRRKLKDDCDPVPCPVCGWYQSFMIPKARSLKWKWLMPVEIGLIALDAYLFLASVAFGSRAMVRPNLMNIVTMLMVCGVFTVITGVAVALPVVKYHLFRDFDPNLEDQEARIAVGKSRAITAAALQKAQSENESPQREE